MNEERYKPAKTVHISGYTFASPKLKGRRHPNSKPYTARTLFVYNVCQVLYAHNRFHTSVKKLVSDATRYKRFTECQAMAHDLHNLGYKLMLPTQIKQKHVKALTHYWESQDLKPSTIAQKLSILRIFITWMGKQAIFDFLPMTDLFKNPENLKRSHVTKEDKSWTTKTDVLAMLAAVEKVDLFVAIQLKMSHYFGLRAKESMMFRPLADYDAIKGVLNVTRGTKGGRPRVIIVETNEQRKVLDEAMSLCHGKRSSLIPHIKSLGAWIKHYYKVCNRHGISRDNGITPHGLRHGYSHRLYEEQTGQECKAVSGETPVVDVIANRIARARVAQDMGHNRESISSAYLG